MKLKVDLIEARLDKWPARGDRPQGEAYRILVRDATRPMKDSLAQSLLFTLSEADREKHWGALSGEDVQAEIVINQLGTKANASGFVSASGRIVSVFDAGTQKPLSTKN